MIKVKPLMKRFGQGIGRIIENAQQPKPTVKQVMSEIAYFVLCLVVFGLVFAAGLMISFIGAN